MIGLMALAEAVVAPVPKATARDLYVGCTLELRGAEANSDERSALSPRQPLVAYSPPWLRLSTINE